MLSKGLDFSVLIIRKRYGREQESAWSPTLYRLRGSFSRFYVQRMKVNMMCQLDLMIAIEIFDFFSKTRPGLSKPEVGEVLFLYLAAGDEALAAVLVREHEGVQKAVYYVSKVLQNGELNYTRLEKLVLTVLISARRLRQYFQSHKIVVLTDQPLREVLSRVDSSGRLLKWGIELTEFVILSTGPELPLRHRHWKIS